MLFIFFFFFFQAEDGIRDLYVTGVQTCALPISSWCPVRDRRTCRESCCRRCCAEAGSSSSPACLPGRPAWPASRSDRSEERRVGKECRSRWSPDHEKKNNET